MDKQVSASYDDVCRICGELYIQVNLNMKKMESLQIELVEGLQSQIASLTAEKDKLHRELLSLRAAWNESRAHGEDDHNSSSHVGKHKD